MTETATKTWLVLMEAAYAAANEGRTDHARALAEIAREVRLAEPWLSRGPKPKLDPKPKPKPNPAADDDDDLGIER